MPRDTWKNVRTVVEKIEARQQAEVPQTFTIATGIEGDDSRYKAHPDTMQPLDVGANPWQYGDTPKPITPDLNYVARRYDPQPGYRSVGELKAEAKREQRLAEQARHDSLGHISHEQIKQRQENFRQTGSYESSTYTQKSPLYGDDWDN